MVKWSAQEGAFFVMLITRNSFVVACTLGFSLAMVPNCGATTDLDCRNEAAACASGFVCAEQSNGSWACSPVVEDMGESSHSAEDGEDESDSRAHRFVWVTAQRDVSIEAIELLQDGGEVQYTSSSYQCPTGPEGQRTCGNLDGPPRGCGVDTSHRIPADSTLITKFRDEYEIGTGDSIIVYLCDDADPADAIDVQIGVEHYRLVSNPLVSCTLEVEGSNARCSVPELPPVVELESGDRDQLFLEYFEAEARDPEWADETEQTILHNIATGTTTDGESVFDTTRMDGWCIECWGTWEMEVDCRTTMCRVIAIGGSIVQRCLIEHLHDLVPFGGTARGSWESDRWVAYYSREGYELPRF